MESIRRFNWLFAFLKHISQRIKGVRKEKLFEVNGTLIHQLRKMIVKIRYSRLLNLIPRVEPFMILGLGSFKKNTVCVILHGKNGIQDLKSSMRNIGAILIDK